MAKETVDKRYENNIKEAIKSAVQEFLNKEKFNEDDRETIDYIKDKDFDQIPKEIKEDIIRICCNKAWNDAMQARRSMADSVKKYLKKNEKQIKKYLKHFIIKSEGKLDNLQYNDEMFEKLRVSDEKGEKDYRLGIWQKFSSMTFKYLYCVQLQMKDGKGWFEIKDYEKVNCPLDSIIALSIFQILPQPIEERIENKQADKNKDLRMYARYMSRSDGKYKKKSCNWSSVHPDVYKALTDTVRNYCESLGEIIDVGDGTKRRLIPLEFDLLCWEKEEKEEKE